MTKREGFAAFIESAGPGILAAHFREGLGPDTTQALEQEWSGRILTPRTTPEEVKAALGPPDQEEPWKLAYLLESRPRYRYTFTFDCVSGALIGSGFERTEPARAPAPPPRFSDAKAVEAYLGRLAEIGATTSDIRSWLGEPVDRYGWWPLETWVYSPDLQVTLRHGMVEKGLGEKPE